MTMTDPATLRTWTAEVTRARLAYYAQPITSFHGGPQPCLAACGRVTRGNAPYCTHCRQETRP